MSICIDCVLIMFVCFEYMLIDFVGSVTLKSESVQPVQERDHVTKVQPANVCMYVYIVCVCVCYLSRYLSLFYNIYTYIRTSVR